MEERRRKGKPVRCSLVDVVIIAPNGDEINGFRYFSPRGVDSISHALEYDRHYLLAICCDLATIWNSYSVYCSDSHGSAARRYQRVSPMSASYD